jgi:hypothetical protein
VLASSTLRSQTSLIVIRAKQETARNKRKEPRTIWSCPCEVADEYFVRAEKRHTNTLVLPSQGLLFCASDRPSGVPAVAVQIDSNTRHVPRKPPLPLARCTSSDYSECKTTAGAIKVPKHLSPRSDCVFPLAQQRFQPERRWLLCVKETRLLGWVSCQIKEILLHLVSLI